MMRGIMLHLKMMHREPKFSLDTKEKKEKEILIFYLVRAWCWGRVGGHVGDTFEGMLAESIMLLPHILCQAHTSFQSRTLGLCTRFNPWHAAQT